jgi:hypothetical protein
VLGVYDLRYRALSDYDFNFKWFAKSRFRKIYFDRIIANFSEGGFSAIHIDIVFQT